MKRKLLGAAILLGLLLPAVAYGDGMDDFTLAGDGYTVTFSEPATGVTSDHPHGVYLTDAVSASVNGSPATGNVQILANFLPGLPSVVFSVPGLPVYALYGPLVDSITVIQISNPTPYDPDNLQLTFNPGVYAFLGQDSSTSQFADFSLAVTPESPAAASTPEPASLALLSTGLAGYGFLLRRRRPAL